MKRINLMIALCAAALGLAACGAPAGNTVANNANTNTDTSRTNASAPTADSLLAMDKDATAAYLKGDSKFFETFLSDKYTRAGHAADKAGSLKAIAAVKCDMKSFNLDEPQMMKIDDDTYAVAYKGTFDGSCNDGPGGKVMQSPSPVRATTVYTRNGDKWQAVFHAENPILTTDKNAAAPKAAEPMKDDKMKSEAGKDEKMSSDKMETANSNSAANSNSSSNSAAAAMTKSPNTEAVAKAELSGWEAWQKKDAKALDAFTAKSAMVVSSDGSVMTDRAAIIKYWAEMPCEGVTKVDVKDPFGVTLSPATELLSFHGWADGTCFGQKNGSQPAVSIYVKEGDGWRLAYSYMGPTDTAPRT